MIGKVIAFATDKVFQLNAAWIFTVQSFSANNLDVSFARTAGVGGRTHAINCGDVLIA
jgi:hypothetical protein